MMLRWWCFCCQEPESTCSSTSELAAKNSKNIRVFEISRGSASNPGCFPWGFWWAKNTGFGCIRMCGLLVGSNKIYKQLRLLNIKTEIQLSFDEKKVLFLVQQSLDNQPSRGTWNDRNKGNCETPKGMHTDQNYRCFVGFYRRDTSGYP